MTEDSQKLDETAMPAVSGEAAPGAPPPTPEAVRDGPGGGALIVAVLLNWGATVAVALLVVHISGSSLDKAGEMSPLNALVASLLSALVTFSIVWYFVCRRYGKPLRVGLVLQGVDRKTLKTWAYISIFLGCTAAAILTLAGQEEGCLLLDLVKQPGGLAALILLALLLPPFEEAYYRGLIQPALARKTGAVAVPLTALWFTSAHLVQLWGHVPGVAVIVAMGLLWSLLRHRYNSLLPSIVSHWCYNATLVVITLGQVLIESVGGA